MSKQRPALGGDARQRTHAYVVEYRQRPVKSIHGGLKLAAERAGLPFGRAFDGATFHTLRHTAASLLAELGEPEAIRKEVMGHRDIATTQRYTHLRPVHEIPAHERLADAVPIADLVTAPRNRASGNDVGKNDGTLPEFKKLQDRQRQMIKLATHRRAAQPRSRTGNDAD